MSEQDSSAALDPVDPRAIAIDLAKENKQLRTRLNRLVDMVDAEQNKRDALLDKLVKIQGELTQTENEVYQANRQRKNYEVRCGNLSQKVADAESREARYQEALMLSLGSVEREGLTKVAANINGLLGERNIHELELKPGDKFQIPSRGIISKCCEEGPATYEYVDVGLMRGRAMRCLKCRQETLFQNTGIQRVVLVS